MHRHTGNIELDWGQSTSGRPTLMWADEVCQNGRFGTPALEASLATTPAANGY